MTTRHPIVGLPPFRRSQFPKSPPRPKVETIPDDGVEVDLSEIIDESDFDDDFYTRPTPMLPPPLPPALKRRR